MTKQLLLYYFIVPLFYWFLYQEDAFQYSKLAKIDFMMSQKNIIYHKCVIYEYVSLKIFFFNLLTCLFLMCFCSFTIAYNCYISLLYWCWYAIQLVYSSEDGYQIKLMANWLNCLCRLPNICWRWRNTVCNSKIVQPLGYGSRWLKSFIFLSYF